MSDADELNPTADTTVGDATQTLRRWSTPELTVIGGDTAEGAAGVGADVGIYS